MCVNLSEAYQNFKFFLIETKINIFLYFNTLKKVCNDTLGQENTLFLEIVLTTFLYLF